MGRNDIDRWANGMNKEVSGEVGQSQLLSITAYFPPDRAVCAWSDG